MAQRPVIVLVDRSHDGDTSVAEKEKDIKTWGRELLKTIVEG